MKHKRFEENILVDEAYTNYDRVDKNADNPKGYGIAKNFAESLEYEEKKKWYHQLPEEPSTITKTATEAQIEEMRKEASSALHGDTLAYETKASKTGSSDHQWAKTLLNKGVIGDRVAAATILIQDNPLYNLTALRNLVNQVKPAKKKDGIVIIDALSELLVTELLIPDVKLRTFTQHSLGHLDEMTSGNKQAKRNILKLWYFEDQLKELYGSYVDALNKFAHDSVDANKEKAVTAMSYLLMHHPEREKMLLNNIINKLGDPAQTVASKVIYNLCQLLFNHPNMKGVVLAEIEKMLFRTNIAPRAQYYGICLLNNFYLGKDDSKIAENLIRIYFSFFKASIKKGEINSRLMSAILTGVKRAYPFANKDRLTDTTSYIDSLYRVVHLSPLNVAVHSLALLYHVSDASNHSADRYYSALYRKLTNHEIFNTSHSALLFSLVFKSLKSDKDSNRVTSFIKRLLQLCCYTTPAQCCGMLFLISQVLKDGGKKDAVRLVLSKQEVKDEVKEETPEVSTTVVDEQSDDDEEQVKNDEEDKQETKKVDLLKGDKKDLLMDDDEETYVDLKLDETGSIRPKKRLQQQTPIGWFHARVKREESGERETGDRELEAKILMKKTINMDKVVSVYSPFARNPKFTGANISAYTELCLLRQHYHPTVQMFAEKLLQEQIIKYTGDPLKDFSGIRFLDRFVFKNPKKKSEIQTDDTGLKKVKGSHPKFAVRKNYAAKGLKSLPVNSASYLNEDASKIPVDEKFLYDFLQKRRELKTDDSDDESDNDSVTSDDFNKYLDTVTGAAKGESDEELDFLSEMESSQQKKGKDKKSEDKHDEPDLGSDDEDEDDVGGDEDIGSDGDLDLSADEDEPVLSGDEDELMLQGSDDDEEVQVPGKKGRGKGKMSLKGKEDLGSLFASAEEFSTLLEDTATNKKQGSSQAVSNTDNSSRKQLAWEEKRDQWIKGYKRNTHGNKKGGKKFNKQNGGNHKMADRSFGGKRKASFDGAGGKKRKVKK